MANESGRDVAARFVRSIGNDPDAMQAVMHPDFAEEWPQSKERIRGPENLRQVIESYPGAARAAIGTREIRGIAGAKDEWVLSPRFVPLQVVGTGDTYTVESMGAYPDGSEWFVVHIIKLKDDLVHRVTTYFGQGFDAPDWRAPFVERME